MKNLDKRVSMRNGNARTNEERGNGKMKQQQQLRNDEKHAKYQNKSFKHVETGTVCIYSRILCAPSVYNVYYYVFILQNQTNSHENRNGWILLESI